MRDVIIVGGKNKHRYVIATQKPKLRALLRTIPAVPLIYVNRSVMIMEPMSPATERARANIEEAKLSGGLNDKNAARKHILEEEEADEEPTKKKRKGPREPNPLSVKKKKTAKSEVADNEKADSCNKKKRKRRHKPKEDTGVDMNDTE
jgi:U3 small nucleolar RNA-associated protein 23